MRKTGWTTLAILALGAAPACSKQKAPVPATSVAEGSKDAPKDKPADAPKAAPIAGPHLAPVATATALSVAVPKDGWWIDVNLACQNAVTGLAPGMTAMDMLAMQNPWLPGAMADGDVDVKRDVVSAGAFACGNEACMFAAVELRDPAKATKILAAYPGDGSTPTNFKQIDPMHAIAHLTGAKGPRTVHLRVVPIDWSGVTTLPDDAWGKDVRRATHAIIFYGVDDGAPEPDPIAALDGGAAGAARVAEAESLASDAHGRCVAGALAPDSEVEPGTKITAAKFVLVAPPHGAKDTAAAAFGSSRTIDIEVVLDFAPAPSEAKVRAWIDTVGAAVWAQVGPLLPQLAATMGPQGEKLIGPMKELAKAGFDHELDGQHLRLSWSTANITPTELAVTGL